MRRGFTTIELMFVLGVSLVVIVAMLGGFINFMVINEHNRNLTLAMNWARQDMESVIALRNAGNFDSIGNVSYVGNVSEGRPGQTWAHLVREVTNVNSDLKYIRIYAGWNEHKRDVFNVELIKSAVARK
jgi:type II secretory pathway pseudopilin PulG